MKNKKEACFPPQTTIFFYEARVEQLLPSCWVSEEQDFSS
jgi:hypothetical protein